MAINSLRVDSVQLADSKDKLEEEGGVAAVVNLALTILLPRKAAIGERRMTISLFASERGNGYKTLSILFLGVADD